MELSVLNIKGEETGRKLSLSKSVFGIEPNEHVVYLDVKQHLANRRQGTHKSKERGEIRGSNRKLRKQKGSGAARVGSIKSPIFRGGGRVFGPKNNRNYGFKLNKSVKRLARKSAFSYQASNENIILLENFTFKTPKTKDFFKVLTALKLNETKTLFILKEAGNIHLSARNIPKVSVIRATELTTYNILNAKKVVILEDTLSCIEKNLIK